MVSNWFRLEGVCAAVSRTLAILVAEGVAVLPPDSESRSNNPNAFPSRCGVGPMAAFKGDWCVLGLKSLRKTEGES